MRRFLYILIPALVLASLIAWRIVQNRQQQAAQAKMAQARKNAPPLVRAAPVVERDIVHAFQGIANVQSPRMVNISPKVTGQLIYLQARPGARVTKGEVIARLDPSEIQASIAQQQANVTSAQANLNNAVVYYRRVYSLYKQGFVAAQDVDNARTQTEVYRGALNAATAQLHNLQYQLQDLLLRSPVNGFVTARNFDPGSVVSAGQAILTVQTMRHVFVTTSAPEDLIGTIQAGMAAEASFDALPGRVFHGRVTHVDPAADPVSREFLVQATFANLQNTIRPGMYGTLTILTHVTHNALVVPREAIKNSPHGPTVTLVQPEGRRARAQVVPVKTGDQDANGVAITQGVQPGEQVVILAAQPVKSGQIVRIDTGAGMTADLAGQPNVEGGVGGAGNAAAPGGISA
ncbi:MAG TPA: efflux RND transporter periplasmic adaptor subunit [Chthonomonadaceae bacterium]|nr:efflux RND transporter periplasmic adaptor subunit [Chthonomonadaceae bacterium]